MAATQQPPPTVPKHFPLISQNSAPANFQSLQNISAVPQGPNPPPGPQPPMVSPNKTVNAATFCRFGQEYIHEIILKATEIFGYLGKPGLLQLTNYQERKTKLEEELKTMCVTFKKLRAIYDKVRETCEELEQPSDEHLIPIVGGEVETLPVSEVYPYVLEEHRELVEQVRVKNQQLKEIIDQIRSINWEINTMITMRKT